MNELSALVRFLNLTASVLLAGSLGFTLFVGRPAYRKSVVDVKADYRSLVRLQLQIAQWCSSAILVTALLGLWLQNLYLGAPAAGTSTGMDAILPLLADTQFGHAWLLRASFLFLLIGLILWVRRFPSRCGTPSYIAAFALSVFVLVGAALSSHASAAEGTTLALHLSADMLHLLACGFWLGGLWPLAAVLAACRRSGDTAALAVAASVTRDFSRLALASAAILIATGIYNAWYLIGDFPSLIGTAYGQLLLAKIALLALMLGLGATNLFVLKPKIINARNIRTDDATRDLVRLTRNVSVEVAAGLGILLIVGHMGLMPPAAHVQPDWPFSFRWDWSLLDKTAGIHDQIGHSIFWAVGGALAMALCTLAPKRLRMLTAAAGLGLCLYAGIRFLVLISVDAYPTTYKRPTVPYQAISIANGALLYVNSGCPACHGSSGYGDGPLAARLQPKPADLTAPHANSHTAGDLFWWISYGVKESAMPGFAKELNEEDRWDLINFLRALSDSERSRNLGPMIEGDPWLIAPDFAYGTRAGASRTLREHRGSKIVLLVLSGPTGVEDRVEKLAAALPRLQSAGFEIIVVPQSGKGASSNDSSFNVSEGVTEILESYGLLARSYPDETLLTHPPGAEFLIDRQGYIRARWLPSEGDAWNDIDALVAVGKVLEKEKPRAAAPDWHMH
jgi:putative copper resistance protein D